MHVFESSMSHGWRTCLNDIHSFGQFCMIYSNGFWNWDIYQICILFLTFCITKNGWYEMPPLSFVDDRRHSKEEEKRICLLITISNDEKTFSWTNQKLVIWMNDIQICEKVLFFLSISIQYSSVGHAFNGRAIWKRNKRIAKQKKNNKERMNERERKERKSKRLHLKSIWRASQSFWRHRAKFLESLSNHFSINKIFVRISKILPPPPPPPNPILNRVKINDPEKSDRNCIANRNEWNSRRIFQFNRLNVY